MADGVSYRFFGDSLHGHAGGGGHSRRRVIDQAQTARKHLAEPASQQIERQLKPGSFHEVRIQIVTQIADLFDNLIEQILDRGGAGADRRDTALQVHSQKVELQSRGAENLGNFVVKKPGQLAALELLLIERRQSQYAK